MKSKSTAILAISFSLFVNYTFGQPISINSKCVLLAEKGNARAKFLVGKRLRIRYSDSLHIEQVRGKFLGASQHGMLVIRGRKRKQHFIHVDSIKAIRRVKTAENIMAGSLGILLVSGAGTLINNGQNRRSSGMVSSIMIPVILGGSIMALSAPINIWFDILHEKKAVDGWTFRVNQLMLTNQISK